MKKNRCHWVTDDPLYIQYHDEEWGNMKQFNNDLYLFEMMILESAQAGLSWLTILKRRDHYRKAFDQYDPKKVAAYDEEKISILLKNKGIIRNRKKIEAAVQNAQAFLRVQNEFGSFHSFLWNFVGEKQRVHSWKTSDQVPAKTEISIELSKELKRRRFTFFGPVICYSYMQAIGLVNDHTADCFLYEK